MLFALTGGRDKIIAQEETGEPRRSSWSTYKNIRHRRHLLRSIIRIIMFFSLFGSQKEKRKPCGVINIFYVLYYYKTDWQIYRSSAQFTRRIGLKFGIHSVYEECIFRGTNNFRPLAGRVHFFPFWLSKENCISFNMLILLPIEV